MTSIPDRLDVALEGRYRVERELGEGGMATVYLARDLKHERLVALKVLKPELAAVVGSERFLAEVRTTANLRHPHILPLFDSGTADGFLFYVMPYVEGETLRQRLDRERQLPVDEAVSIAEAVASALSSAHAQGIVHRDIKPENILLGEGGPLVADFGVAIAVSTVAGDRLTETGVSVGTPFYMSPEQATGDQAVGPASDLYALGCVLYETLVGEPPYVGSTAQAILGKILIGEPVSATAVRRTVPEHVDAVIRKALERVPADRFSRAENLAGALRDPSFRHGAPVTSASAGGSWRTVALVAVSLAILSTVGLLAALSRPSEAPPVIRYQLAEADGQEVVEDGFGGFGPVIALSPDGYRMAFVGRAPGGGHQIWVRERDALDARPLVGTEGGSQPFFSPDGSRVGFMVRETQQIRVASLGGEPPFTLVDSGVIRYGGSWSADGRLYFSALPDGGLYRVSAAGGEPEPMSRPDTTRNERRHGWPDVLPSGNGALVTVHRDVGAYSPDDDVGIVDFETGTVRVLFHGTLGRYMASGHVLFVDHEGGLFAAPFDADRLELTGPIVPLQSGLEGRTRGPALAVSRSGRIAYRTRGASGHELVWVDRDGAVTPTGEGWVFRPPPATAVSLSPEGHRVAISAFDSAGGTSIWVKELGGGLTRLAFGGNNYVPHWAPDGRSVVFVTNRYTSEFSLVSAPADGTGPERVLVDMPEVSVSEGRWSPDGAWLLFGSRNDAREDIFGMRAGQDSLPRPLFGDPDFRESSPQVSPDGRFIAYSSDESGRSEVYVRPFPDVAAARYTVSTGGGVQPLWAHSAREIFYVNPERELVAARVTDEDGFRVVSRDPLFQLPLGTRDLAGYTQYDVSADDGRFLMSRLLVLRPPVTVVVENFHQELNARVGR